MCGIIGFVDKRNVYSIEEKQRLISGMLAILKHRGPDGEGVHVQDNIAMAQARLSIVDLSPAGLQPMWNTDRTVAITVNGEIYNHPALREILRARYTYHSHSDSESLLHAYEEWGDQCLERCKGMFATAIFDSPKKRIFLAVDRFGIKPLYYIDSPEWFAWASEAKALLTLPGVKRAINTNAVGEQLAFRAITGRETLFEGIYKGLPGESIVFQCEKNELERKLYWSPRERETASIEEIQKLLTQSIKEHLLSDVPIGVQLSGGLDSSLVSAIVRSEIGTNDLHSYSIGLRDEEWNEFPFSRAVASRLQTIHHEMVFSEQDFCRNLPIATFHYDEPIHHSHSVPMMLLAQEAKKSVTVLMSGEGADEIFGGYRRYTNLLSHPLTRETLVYSNAFADPDVVRSVISGITLDVSVRENVADSVAHHPDHMQLAYYDLRTYLTTLLLRQDKMGMRFGIENRVPFLDHELVEAALHLPRELRVAHSETKVALKTIAEQYLPTDIVYRKKVGFAQPLAAWLRNKSGLGAFLYWYIHPSLQREYLDYGATGRLIEEHFQGISDHTHILWSLMNLELWTKIFIDRIPPEEIWSSISINK